MLASVFREDDGRTLMPEFMDADCAKCAILRPSGIGPDLKS
jgi:hypothetical protein